MPPLEIKLPTDEEIVRWVLEYLESFTVQLAESQAGLGEGRGSPSYYSAVACIQENFWKLNRTAPREFKDGEFGTRSEKITKVVRDVWRKTEAVLNRLIQTQKIILQEKPGKELRDDKSGTLSLGKEGAELLAELRSKKNPA